MTDIALPSVDYTVSGTTTISILCDTPVDYVQLTIDGTTNLTKLYTLQGFDTPFAATVPFDSTICSQGSHSLQATAYTGTFRNTDPTSISGCQLWVDFGDTSSLTISSGAITAVNDKTGIHSAFSVPSGSSAPLYLANRYHGQGVAQFLQASSQLLQSTSSLSGTSGDVFAVVHFPSTPTGDIVLGAAATNNNTNWLECQAQDNVMNFACQTTANGSRNVSATGTGSAMSSGGMYLMQWRCISSGSSPCYQMWMNGISLGITTTGNDGANWFGNMSGSVDITLGGLKGLSNTFYGNLEIAEVIVFNGVLSSTNRHNVEGYLAEKWGVPGYTAQTISYTSQSSDTVTFNVDNPFGMNLPTIAHHFPHIKTYHYQYQPLVPADQALLESSLDLGVISDATGVETVQAASATMSMARYACVTKLSWYQILDLCNFLDDLGVDREDCFYHVDPDQSMTGTNFGAQGFPVRYWWDAQQYVYSGNTMTRLFTLQSGHATLDGASTFLTDGTSHVTLGASANDAIWLGYNERFDEINWTFSTPASGGWTAVLEYPTAVDADSVPTAWGTITLASDTTSGCTTSGRMHWDASLLTDWVKAYSVPGGAAMLKCPDPSVAPTTGMQGYYVRLRTTAPGTTPIVSDCHASNYLNQSGTSPAGTVKVWPAAFDTDGDGYLNDSEYALAGSPTNGSGNQVRFKYQSRFVTGYGSNVLWSNIQSPNCQEWIAGFIDRAIVAYPMYDGIFCDDSSLSDEGFAPVQTVEDTSTYGQSYGQILSVMWRLLPAGPRGQRFFILNMGRTAAPPLVIGQCPMVWREDMLKDSDGWTLFWDNKNVLDTTAGLFCPEPVQVVDTFCTYASSTQAPLDTTKMALLAYYYCLARPGTYFQPLGNNTGTANVQPDPSHLDQFQPNRWIPFLSVNVGQPVDDCYIFAGGPTVPDPTLSGYYYEVIGRNYTNALVLFKPLSDDGSGAVNADTITTVTTHDLPAGTWYPLNTDGSITQVPVTSVTLANGHGAIFLNTLTP